MSRYLTIAAIGSALAAILASDGSAAPTKLASSGVYVTNIEASVVRSGAFRRVLHTGTRSQLVAMQIPVNSDIGEEKHDNVEQTFVVIGGAGKLVIEGKAQPIVAGDLVVVPKGTKHNVVNDGGALLQLYTISTPPNHIDGRVHQTKRDAENDTADEAFGKAVR